MAQRAKRAPVPAVVLWALFLFGGARGDASLAEAAAACFVVMCFAKISAIRSLETDGMLGGLLLRPAAGAKEPYSSMEENSPSPSSVSSVWPRLRGVAWSIFTMCCG